MAQHKTQDKQIDLFWLCLHPSFPGAHSMPAVPRACWHRGHGRWICLGGNNRQGIKKQNKTKRDLVLQWAHLLNGSFEARHPNHSVMDWY